MMMVERFKYKGRNYEIINQKNKDLAAKALNARAYIRLDNKRKSVVLVAPDMSIKQLRHRIVKLNKAIRASNVCSVLPVWYELKTKRINLME